jgi:putative methyltransferase (TIGR04325 family)
MTVKRVVRGITPPVLMTAWHRLASRMRHEPAALPEWEYVADGWSGARVDSGVAGWDVVAVREAYREKLQVFRNGLDTNGPLAAATSPLWRANTPNIHNQTAVLSFAYALTLAARNGRAVSGLDWGGGVGLYSLLGAALLPHDVELEYHCKDLPLVCELGRSELPGVHFHDDDSCLDRSYDLVFASSSIQYSEPWGEVFDGLASATKKYLYLARVPVVSDSPSFVVRQRAYERGIDTEYVSWVFNRRELLDRVERAGLDLTREFIHGYKPLIHGAPEQDETRGFLFEPRARR